MILSKEIIVRYFREEKVSLTKHFTQEMEKEELGEITTDELMEASAACEIIVEYPDDKPYPSLLILGFTQKGRPLHFVCAWDESRDILVLITVYEPKKELWTDYRKRIES